MTDPDPAVIAERLSEAQRRWIGRSVLGSMGWIVASSRMDHSIRATLFRRGIMVGGGFSRLTPLGQQVRAHLIKDSSRGRD